MTKQEQLIRSATSQGYSILADGRVLSKTGNVVSGYLKLMGGVKYRCFSLVFEEKSTHLLVHRLQGFQMFGEAIFRSDIVVRHLDGNSLNNAQSNLALGSQSDNSYDRPEVERVRHAKVAARTQRRLSDEQVLQLRTDRAAGMTLKDIMTKYSIAKSTASYIVNRKTYT